MRNECLNLIGDCAFLKEDKPQITRLQVYNDILKEMYEWYLSIGYSEDSARRFANISAVRWTNTEYYNRIKDDSRI